MWYYDRSDNICKSFVYGGCEGNGNRFEKRTDCETSCVKKVVKGQNFYLKISFLHVFL
ncbi:unnamed protein product [Larinioides sclopetarius]|uniref:BPTI/Kunitz inhibitor domain-containing protein n=1 Tax=Larinioides sclopetarius TaxID=280406 RepID=A0AAV1Z5J4_9ARAC